MTKRRSLLFLRRKLVVGLCIALLLCSNISPQVYAAGNAKELKTVRVGYLLYEG